MISTGFIIAPSCRSIEPKTCDALAARLAPNHFFAVGPLSPPAGEAMSKVRRPASRHKLLTAADPDI